MKPILVFHKQTLASKRHLVAPANAHVRDGEQKTSSIHTINGDLLSSQVKKSNNASCLFMTERLSFWSAAETTHENKGCGNKKKEKRNCSMVTVKLTQRATAHTYYQAHILRYRHSSKLHSTCRFPYSSSSVIQENHFTE